MNQKHSTVTEDVSELSEIEREYAQLLLVLNRRCLLNQIPYTWRCKRKRSVIQNSSFHSSSSQTLDASASKPNNSSSPITPLSFPLTQSHNSLTKISLKRKKEYYLQIIQDLTKTKAELNQELENVKLQHDKLKASNLKLKRREQQLIGNNGLKSECKISDLKVDLAQQLDQSLSNGSQDSSKSTDENEEQKLQLLQIQNSHQNENFETSQIVSKYVSDQMASLGNNKETLHLPDLNLPIEEFFHVDNCEPLDETTTNKDLSRIMAAQARLDNCEPLDETTTNKDLSRIMAAQARQRRHQILRLKKKPIGA